MTKLTIVIPYYKTQEMTDELMEKLDSQINEFVQVILVYDKGQQSYLSNYDWLEMLEQPDRGLGRARNYGVLLAKGEYITFVDSDDWVADNYIQKIYEKIDAGEFDVCEMSWTNIPGYTPLEVILTNDNDKLPEWNWACWSRVYKRELIENIHFPDGWDEDVPFIQRVYSKMQVRVVIPDIMYYYRTSYGDSRTQRHLRGEDDIV